MNRKQFAKLRKAAKLLSNPSWIKRYHGGDRQKAKVALSERFGFSGRPSAMALMCDLLAEHPDYDDFCAALERDENEAGAAMASHLSAHEVSVDATLSSGTDPSKVLWGECYPAAYAYFNDHEEHGAVLVHGSIVCAGDRTNHAWTEIPECTVFDGVVQRFYDKAGYYAAMQALKTKEYPGKEARLKLVGNHHYGPWD